MAQADNKKKATMTVSTVLLACFAATAICSPALTTAIINGETVNVRFVGYSDNPAIALIATAVMPPFVVAMSIADIACCAVRLGSGGDFPCPKSWAPSELPVNKQLVELTTETFITILLALLYTITAYLTLRACRLAWAISSELMVLLDKRKNADQDTPVVAAAAAAVKAEPRRASMRLRTRASVRAATPSAAPVADTSLSSTSAERRRGGS